MPRHLKSEEKKSVLIVEDSVDFSNLLKFIVEDDGLEGIQFPVNQDDILTVARQHKPSAILMDLALRRKTGMEYIDDLKSDPDTKNIPIIIISGRDLGQKEVLELQVRGIKYLRKGRVEMHEIRREIRNAVHAKASPGAAPTRGPAGG